MRIPHLNTIFFFFVFFLTGMMVFLVMQPFLTSILAAAVLATLFYGWYRYFLRIFGGRCGLSALSVLMLVALLIILPIILLVTMIVGEATSALSAFSSGDYSINDAIRVFQSWFSRFPFVAEYLNVQDMRATDVLRGISSGGSAFISFLQTLSGSAASVFFWIFTLFFTLFYFLIDGERVVEFLKRMSPLSDSDDEVLMRDFVSMSRAIIKGSIMIAVIQGIVGGVGVAVSGVSSPAIWGVVMGIFSLIPAVGSGLVWFPMGTWLLLSGHVWQGVFLLVFGMSIVSTIDNILRPKLVGRDTQIHPLLVFFSTIGGISFFGVAGLLVGPLLMSFFLALVRIYAREFKVDLDSYNKNDSA